jgi:hypothetical protein
MTEKNKKQALDKASVDLLAIPRIYSYKNRYLIVSPLSVEDMYILEANKTETEDTVLDFELYFYLIYLSIRKHQPHIGIKHISKQLGKKHDTIKNLVEYILKISFPVVPKDEKQQGNSFKIIVGYFLEKYGWTLDTIKQLTPLQIHQLILLDKDTKASEKKTVTSLAEARKILKLKKQGENSHGV